MKKIALVADVPNWAFDLAAHIIKKAFEDKIQVDIYYTKSVEFNKDLFKILETLKDYDVIHFFWREILLDFEKDEFIDKVKEKYGNYDEYVNNIIKKISTGVYDHLYEDNLKYNQTFTKYCKKYVVSSKTLFEIYSNEENVKKPYLVMGDSFEKTRFFPYNMNRFEDENGPLVIGWVGNSAWNEKQKDENGNSIDFKGFHTILKPAVDELIKEGVNLKLYCADKNVKQIPNEEMNEYYSKIQVYVCVSYNEGTPKPLLESMGCGVPVITTDVGVARDALGKLGQDYILSKRIINKNEEQIKEELKDKIRYLYNNRDVLNKLSKENYESSKKYEIESMGKVYYKYFNEF